MTRSATRPAPSGRASADRFIPDEERQRAQETGKDARAIHFLKRFTVFNVEQCDGLPAELAVNRPGYAGGCLV